MWDGSSGSPGYRSPVTSGRARRASATFSAVAFCRSTRSWRVAIERCCEPGLHGPGNRTDDLAPAPYGGHRPGIAAGHVAQQDVAVAGELLGAAGHREVGAERQRALTQRRGERVVHGDQGATRVGRLGESPDVAHVEPRVGRRLDPQQLRPVQDVELGVPAGRRGAHLDAVRLQLIADQRQRLIAVVGQDGYVTGAQLGEEHRGDRAAMPEANTSVSTSSCPGASSSRMARSRWVQVGFSSRP